MFSMRMGHYLRVAWLLTELGENSVFPRRELEQVKRKILLLRSISDFHRVQLIFHFFHFFTKFQGPLPNIGDKVSYEAQRTTAAQCWNATKVKVVQFQQNTVNKQDSSVSDML